MGADDPDGGFASKKKTASEKELAYAVMNAAVLWILLALPFIGSAAAAALPALASPGETAARLVIVVCMPRRRPKPPFDPDACGS